MALSAMEFTNNGVQSVVYTAQVRPLRIGVSDKVG